MVTTENLYFLFLQVFSSGVAGYITNKYAVNMIFKEYTPLKIGGAVKKNKEKFIEEISDLVERDIINSSTIKKNVLSDEFKKTVDETVKDFLGRSLIEVFEDTTIEEIVDVNETIDNGEIFLRNNFKNILPKVFDNIGQHIKINDILSDDQINIIVNYIYNEIIINLEKNEENKKLLINLYNEQKNLCLKELISIDTKEKITRIISCEIMNSIDELLDNKKETKQLVDKVLSLIDIKSIMKDLQKTIGTRSIEDVLGEDGINRLSLVIYKNLDSLIKSKEGKKIIKQLVDEGILSAKNINLTIFELLPIHFGRTSSEFLMKVIKYFTPYLITWIESNKEKIEKVIDDSICESIDNINDDLRKSMILKVKDSMLSDFAVKNNIVEKINDYIRNNSDSEELSSKLYDKIIKFLETTKIKDIMTILEKNNLIDDERISEIILDKWDCSGEEISMNILKQQSYKSINSIVNQDFYKLFNKFIKPQIYDSINLNKKKITSYLDKMVFNIVSNKVEDLINREIKDLVKDDKVSYISKRLPKNISKHLTKNSLLYKNKISNVVRNYIEDINMSKLIKEKEDIMVSISTEKIIEISKNYIDKYKKYEVKDLLENISDKESLVNNISEKTYEEIVENLPNIVNGRVKEVIYDNLIKLDEDELCNIAQSFMGKQLKPLSMFGAFLGSIVGLVFGLALQNVNGSYGFYNNIQNTLIACLILGGIGVMTNVIALWMIFCPYERNNFVSKIPIFRVFSLGYIPAHKNSFASGMAYFIDNELLSGKRLSKLFKEKRNNIKDSILDNIINNKNSKILNFIRGQQESLCKYIYDLIIKIYRKNTELIRNLLSKSLLRVKGSKIIEKKSIEVKVKNYIENLNTKEDKIVNLLEEKLKNNKSISDILPKDVTNVINGKINSEIKILINTKLNIEYIEKISEDIVLSNSSRYHSLLNKEIKEILNEKVFINIEKLIKNDKTVNLVLIQMKEILNEIANDYLLREINEDKCFSEIFDGKLKNKIDEDLNNFTEKTIDRINYYAKENVEIIYNLVIKMVRSNLNFFVKMAYDFADGDGLVKDVVVNIVNNKLEDLLKDDKNQIELMISNTLEEKIYPSCINDLGITTKEINISLVLDRFIYGLRQREEFKSTIYEAEDLIMNNIGYIKVKELSEALNINTLESLYSKCGSLVNSLLEYTIQNIKLNETEVCEFVYDLINTKMMSKLYSISLVEISWEINSADILYTVRHLTRKINESSAIWKYLFNLNDNMYERCVSKELNEILDLKTLEKDIRNTLNMLIENKDFNEKNKSCIKEILELVISDDFNLLSKDLKIFVADKLTEGTFSTAENYMIPLLLSLDLKDITTKEVENMNPREIHMLFKSFAGNFFKKLYIYGGFGFIFGINIYLSIILLLIDAIYTKRIEGKAVNMETNIFED